MKSIGLVALQFALAASVATALAQNDEPKKDPAVLNFEDVFQLEFASDPQISPDGKRIVYVRNYFDIMTDRQRSDVWMIDENGAHVPLLSGGKQNYTSPRWSPDGSRLAFVTGESGSAQIHCLWLDSGRVAQLTHLTESPSGITWSTDGRQLGFFMRVSAQKKPFVKLPNKPDGAQWAEPPVMITKMLYRADGRGYLPEGFSHLFVLSGEGGTPRQLTDGDFHHGGEICWTPDNQSIIFSANRHDDHEYQPRNSELYEIALQDRSIKQLTDRLGPDASPALSADGRYVAYLGYDDQLLGYQNNRLYLMERDGTGSRAVTSDLDRSVGPPQWNGDRILFSFADQGNTKLASCDLQGQVTVLAESLGSNATGRPYGGEGPFSVSADGTIALCTTTPEHPGDLAVLSPGQSIQRLTHLNADLLDHKELGRVEEIRFRSSHDKRQIQGWVIKPPGFDAKKKYPLILEIHGGPYADYGDRFTAELQLYASHGYVVLYVNPRGSTSYGQEFADLIQHNYPGQDYDDLMSGVDALVERGYVDPHNLFVTGGSGGGVLSSWIVGNTDRFRAAVVAKPVINWYSFCLTADMYNSFYKYWFPGLPWEFTEEYMKRSPISRVGNVTTPTMLLTGEVDFRTPISESEQFYQALKLRKVDTALVRIPGASHGIAARPSHLIAKVAYVLQWFEQHRQAAAPSDAAQTLPAAGK